jgi:hypothetical protein
MSFNNSMQQNLLLYGLPQPENGDVQRSDQQSRKGGTMTPIPAQSDKVEYSSSQRRPSPTMPDVDSLQILLNSEEDQKLKVMQQETAVKFTDSVEMQKFVAQLERDHITATDGHLRLQKAEQREKKKTDIYREEGNQVPKNGENQAAGSQS